MQKQNTFLLTSLLLLFLLQLLTDFVASIYAFGLLVVRLTAEIAAVVLIFAPFVLIFFRRVPGRRALLVLITIALTCRLVAPFLPLSGHLLLSGLGVAALLVFFPAWLAGRGTVQAASLAAALSLAVLLSILLRTMGSGSDVSLTNPVAAVFLVAVAAWLQRAADLMPETPPSAPAPASFARCAGLGLGLAAVLVMVYFAFASPTVIARWTGFSYLPILLTLLVAWVLWGWWLGQPRLTNLLTSRFVLAWNALFVIALVLTLLPHQLSFPADAALYPLNALPSSPLAALPLLAMLMLSPVLALDFALFARALAAERPSVPQLGGAFGLAALFVLWMAFCQVFTSVYDYVPLIGPLFRDHFWVVYLLAGSALVLPLLLVRQPTLSAWQNRTFTWLSAALALGAIVAVWFTTPHPVAPSATPLKIMTFNIQQGFDSTGRPSLEGQLDVIREQSPVILGLQESDTARIVNGNVDAVRYFADHLKMYSYYGPSTTTGTFGIALLSKYPILNPQTVFLYSKGEQTAAILAQVVVNGKAFNVVVTHLGNDGPPIQVENLLARLQGLENLVVMGDFNLTPATQQYALIVQGLADSWGLAHVDQAAGDPQRIDYIFVSPATKVLASDYFPNAMSDHPTLVTVVQP